MDGISAWGPGSVWEPSPACPSLNPGEQPADGLLELWASGRRTELYLTITFRGISSKSESALESVEYVNAVRRVCYGRLRGRKSWKLLSWGRLFTWPLSYLACSSASGWTTGLGYSGDCAKKKTNGRQTSTWGVRSSLSARFWGGAGLVGGAALFHALSPFLLPPNKALDLDGQSWIASPTCQLAEI